MNSGVFAVGRRSVPRRRLVLAGLLVALGLSFLATSSAHAALISTVACDNAPLTQPFAHWGDSNSYKLAPGGDFESGAAGWTLTGGAHVVSGNEPFAAAGASGSHSLYLPAGSTAQTPLTCVNAAYPSIRLFAKNNGLLGSVLVQLVYKDPVLGLVALPAGTATLSWSWQPTLPMLTLSAVPGLLDGGTAQVALRFTALLGPSQIDDVFVDPRLRA